MAPALSAAASSARAAPPPQDSAAYPEIFWEELLPPERKEDVTAGANFPPNPALQGKRVKLRGFVVPLDWKNEESELELAEFLLVPYFGACIHVPPPPANQIVHVRPRLPLRGVRSMDLLQVYGTLLLEENFSDLGSSTYSLELERAEAYAENQGMPVAAGFGLTLLIGLSAGLGGLLALSRKTPAPGTLCLGLSLAAGLMISFALATAFGRPASGEVLPENAGVFLAGILLMLLLQRLGPGEACPVRRESGPASPPEEQAHFLPRTGKIAALAVGMHNFPEGFALFNAALADPRMGLTLGGAIAAHNIPLGAAVALALYHSTHKRGQAFGYALLAGLMQPAGALLGFLVLHPFLTPAAGGMLFSCAGGIMLVIAVRDLLPAARSYGGKGRRLAGLCAGVLIMGAVLLLTTRG
jgi:ZIP family zinc transporter